MHKDLEVSETVEKKPLFLILKKEYFDQILEGTKKTEYREDKPFYRSRLVRDGKYRNFKEVTFKEGYNRGARVMTLEVVKITLGTSFFSIDVGEIKSKNF